MHLILHHVLQSLIVDWAREDVTRQHLTSKTGHEQVFSIETVPMLDQNASHLINWISSEGSSVLLLPRKHASLA